MKNRNIKKIIKQITRIVRKEHLDYNQVKYVFKQVRKQCGLKPTKRGTGAKEHLSIEEGGKLIDLAYGLSGDLGLMMKVLLFTGLRNDEFVNIRMQDVYLEEKKIYVWKPKGKEGHERYVPLFDFYLHELKLYMDKENRTRGYLFESQLNDKYSTRRIQQIVKRLVSKAGIEKRITPHRLRATVAVWLKEKGVPEEQIQRFLGHAKIETTQIYTKGAVLDLSEMGRKLIEN